MIGQNTDAWIKAVARQMAQRIMEQEAQRPKTVYEMYQEFLAVPSYVERFVKLVHTDEHPQCDDDTCPCHAA